MRVEKLELIGFKSFGDRTVFNFHPGITCIVGPNGCGKSNVVDSFKWVLGEQSAKSLRGDKMEEVIFTGTHSKKPKGMAEVTLHMTGLGGAENGRPTSVTRRLYRSGDSDYMVNRDICRLKDLRDIFLDTGLEIKSYSILEQDRIAAILNAKPEERRFIIEEVAGVMKYKVRRSEALSKLDSSRRNLERVTDIINEVKRQINALDRQVKKAERYRKLMEELRVVELRIAKHEHSGLTSSLDEILNEMQSVREKEASRRARLASAESELETGKIALLDREKLLDSLMNEFQDVRDEMSSIERAIAVLNTERENLKENVVRLRLQDGENIKKMEETSERRREIASMKDALLADIDALKEDVGRRLDDISASENEIGEKETLLEAGRRSAFAVSEEMSMLRNEIVKFAASFESLSKKEDTLDREASELSAYLDDIDKNMVSGEAALRSLQNDHRLAVEERGVVENEIASLKGDIDSLKSRISAGREEYVSMVSRIESLKEMSSKSSGDDGDLDNALATISDVIEVPEAYERAVEGALREAVNGKIMPDYEDVKLAVRALRTKEGGRIALIAANAGAPGSGERILPEGAIAWASDLVKIRNEFSAVVNRLLGHVVVVKDVETALSLNGFVSVTLDGEIVELTGAVIAGRGKGILPLLRQIRELESESEGKKAAIAALNGELENAAAGLLDKESLLKDISDKTLIIEKDASLRKQQVEIHAADIERTNTKLSYVRLEKEETQRERETIKAMMSSKEDALRALDEKKKSAEEHIAAIQSEISSRKESFEKKRSESVDLRLSLNTLKEKSGAVEKEDEALSSLMNELGARKESIFREISLAEQRINERDSEIASKEEGLRTIAVRAGELETRVKEEREKIQAESDAIQSAEKGLKDMRAEVEQTSRALSELDVRRAEYSVKAENLVSNIRNAYGVELAELETGPPVEDDDDRLLEIKKKIEDLGPVSLGSIEEYEELKKRYDFLSGQQEDLKRSIAELEEAIKKINSTTRKKLREAYDALKVKFSEVFVTLFGGGRAELVLTDEDNILETGIDIVSQPPGKRLQNINLLSGGEKTLTALALLFSCFLIKPTPLCILDEADAALDESNTDKFSNMLKDLSSGIQFIVITHNKVTMEAADYIYGVTMEEPGVSKVVSMRFAEA